MKKFILAFLALAGTAFAQPTTPINNARLQGTTALSPTNASPNPTFTVPSGATLTIASGGSIVAASGSTVTGFGGGGGGTPGGSSGQVQYNNAGSFGGFTTSGDATVNTGTGALTLATVNSGVGSFGSATATGTFTVNAKGLITAASSTTITPAVGSILGLGTGVGGALAQPINTATGFVTLNTLTGSYLPLTGGTLTGILSNTNGTDTDLTWGSGSINTLGGLSVKKRSYLSGAVVMDGALTAGGAITLSGLNTANGVLQTNGSGVVSTTLTPAGLTSVGVATINAPAATDLALNPGTNKTVQVAGGENSPSFVNHPSMAVRAPVNGTADAFQAHTSGATPNPNFRILYDGGIVSNAYAIFSGSNNPTVDYSGSGFVTIPAMVSVQPDITAPGAAYLAQTQGALSAFAVVSGGLDPVGAGTRTFNINADGTIQGGTTGFKLYSGPALNWTTDPWTGTNNFNYLWMQASTGRQIGMSTGDTAGAYLLLGNTGSATDQTAQLVSRGTTGVAVTATGYGFLTIGSSGVALEGLNHYYQTPVGGSWTWRKDAAGSSVTKMQLTDTALIVDNITSSAATNLALAAGSSGATATLGQSTNGGVGITAKGTGDVAVTLGTGAMVVNGVTGTGPFNVRAETDGNMHVRSYSTLNGSGTGFALDSLNNANGAVTGVYIRGSAIKLDGAVTAITSLAATSPAFTTSITTPSTTFALLNTTATTVNAFGAATTVNLGASASGAIYNLGGAATAAQLRFIEPGGSNYTALKAGAQSADITYTWPATVGASGSYLYDTAGNGTLSWNIPSTGMANNSALFTSTADAANDHVASDTSVIGTGVGSKTTTANYFAAGTVLIIDVTGYITTALTPDTLNVKIKAGATTVGSTGAITTTGSLSNAVWRILAIVTCRTAGASGTFIVNTIYESTGATLVAPNEGKILNTATVTLDTTGTLAWDVTAIWGSTTAGDVITGTNALLFTPGNGAVIDPGANGIMARTALNTTTARTITGTANQITVTNGDGVSGNPTLSIPSSAILPGSPTVSGTASTAAGGITTIDGTQTLTNKTLTSPTLTTPALGTPASGVLTNATGLPAAAVVAGTFSGVSTATSWNVVSPVITTGLTASGSAANTFEGSTGTFLTSTGAVTIGPGATGLTGVATFTPPVRTSGVASYLTVNIPADTGQTASTESIGENHVTATRTWADGTVALQRERFFAGPTYNKTTTAATFTDTFNLYLTPPIPGTGVTFTRGHTLGVVDSTSAASAITGAVVVATTIGTSATSVGIGGGNIFAGGNITASGTATITGAATAASINKVAITAPATSATLTVADGITLTATNTTNLARQSSTGLPCEFALACSDLTTTLTTGTTKAYFRAPYAFTVTEVRASVNTPQTSGSLLTVDINDSGTSILSTKLTIDNNENTSQTAATPPVISDTAIGDDAIIAVDIDTVGTGAVTGLVIWVKGYR